MDRIRHDQWPALIRIDREYFKRILDVDILNVSVMIINKVANLVLLKQAVIASH